MTEPWRTVVAIAIGLGLIWVGLLIALAAARPKDISVRGVLRLLPDTVILLRRLAADPALPRGIRVRLLLMLLYLLLPIDLVPDFIPVLGHADDAIVVAVALRSVVRRAGADALDEHWPGTPEGLQAVRRLSGLSDPPAA
ncbi:YkvA family protein [Mycolicibacterium sp.]|uniref:YkvA family protein n=1 Tax=Mycolicibacterium sp. TaxID=2320850 RepID=UPI003D0FB75F